MDNRPMIVGGSWYQVETPGMDTIRGKVVLVDRDHPPMLWLQKAGEPTPVGVVLGPGTRITEVPDPTPAREQVKQRLVEQMRSDATGRSAEQIVGDATAERGEGPAGPVPERIRADRPEPGPEVEG
jgi:hypothetical protein